MRFAIALLPVGSGCHSDPKKYLTSAVVWFLVPDLSSVVGKRLDQAPSERPLEIAIGC